MIIYVIVPPSLNVPDLASPLPRLWAVGGGAAGVQAGVWQPRQPANPGLPRLPYHAGQTPPLSVLVFIGFRAPLMQIFFVGV